MNSPLNCVHIPSVGGGSDGGNMVARLATFYVHNIQSSIPTNVTSSDRARSTRQNPPKDIRTRLGARMHANVRDRVRARAPKQHQLRESRRLCRIIVDLWSTSFSGKCTYKFEFRSWSNRGQTSVKILLVHHWRVCIARTIS